MIRTLTLLALISVAAMACSDVRETSDTGAAHIDAAPTDAAPTATRGSEAGQLTPVTLSPRRARLWSRSCALCHVDGTAFAPRIGVSEERQARLARGSETLLQNTLDGFNDMPPLGYCMACDRDDFMALIEFMSQSGASP